MGTDKQTDRQTEMGKTQGSMKMGYDLNSLPAKSVLAGTKLVLFGRYVLKFYIGIVQ
jgi:hypothetical protein